MAATGLGAVILALGLLATGDRAAASARQTALKLNPDALAA